MGTDQIEVKKEMQHFLKIQTDCKVDWTHSHHLKEKSHNLQTRFQTISWMNFKFKKKKNSWILLLQNKIVLETNQQKDKTSKMVSTNEVGCL